MKQRFSPLQIAALYFIFGAAWILFSDTALHALVQDAELENRLQTVKGSAFTFVTGGVVYWLLSQLVKDLKKKNIESKRAERAFLESEERFRVLVEHAPEAITMIDADTGLYVDANPVAVTLHGLPRDELIGKFGPADMSPEFQLDGRPSSEAAMEYLSLALAGELPRFEWTHLAPDGQEALCEICLARLPDPHRNLVRASITDITERKRMEDALRKSEECFKDYAEVSSDWFWEMDADLRFSSFSGRDPIVKRLLSDATGKTRWEFLEVDPETDPQWHEHRATLESHEPFRNFIYSVLDSQGSKQWWQKSGVPVFGEDGSFLGYRGSGSDITQRKQTEDSVVASRARLAGILDIAPEAVITVGADMNIQLFNQGAERIFGYESGEVLGRSLDILVPEYFRTEHRRHVEAFDCSGETFRLMDSRQEILGLRKDGAEFPASASVSKLELDGEKFYTVMLHDISGRKQTQDALEAAKLEAEVANSAKSEFLAAMSHDLRTPLNAILGFADIISHQYFGPIGDKYQEYASDIHASGEHLLELVNEILDLSAIEAGQKSLDKEELDVQEIVTDCEKIVSTKARSGGVELTVNVLNTDATLYADRRAVRQILLNLLSNAINFTPEGGEVVVSTMSPNGKVIFTVADTGQGMPPEDLEKLTEPFVRGQYDPYVAKDGWGLGLAIVKSLVNLHDGEFVINSQVGSGTTVTVTFPVGA